MPHYEGKLGDEEVSRFERSPPDRAVWVRTLAGDFGCVLGQDA